MHCTAFGIMGSKPTSDVSQHRYELGRQAQQGRPFAAVGHDMALLPCRASNQPFAASANEYAAHSAAYFLLMFFAALTVSVTCRRY